MPEESAPSLPLRPVDPAVLTQAGALPLRKGPVRFAVGSPNGVTSNSWKLWANKKGDVYIACRDNFKEARVSVHASGRWRMGFTADAVAKNAQLLSSEQNRAWEVWDQPPASLPYSTIAFRLLFPTAELAVRPEQRPPDQWRDVFYIEAAPPGKLTALTLFVTNGDVVLSHESERSFRLASLAIGPNKYAQLVAHGEPEGTVPDMIDNTVAEARRRVEASGKEMPREGYMYILGKWPDGSRFLVGARTNRQALPMA
jgi:hypothetical protein